MKTSSKGIDLIKSFEGFKAKPYLCPANVVTQGYGSTRKNGGERIKLTDKPITEAQATEYLKADLVMFESIVRSSIKVPLNQNQFDALVSHTYNTGGSNTLFSLVNNKETDHKIRFWFENKYVMGGGKRLLGLERRRKAEADLFFS